MSSEKILLCACVKYHLISKPQVIKNSLLTTYIKYNTVFSIVRVRRSSTRPLTLGSDQPYHAHVCTEIPVYPTVSPDLLIQFN